MAFTLKLTTPYAPGPYQARIKTLGRGSGGDHTTLCYVYDSRGACVHRDNHPGQPFVEIADVGDIMRQPKEVEATAQLFGCAYELAMLLEKVAEVVAIANPELGTEVRELLGRVGHFYKESE